MFERCGGGGPTVDKDLRGKRFNRSCSVLLGVLLLLVLPWPMFAQAPVSSTVAVTQQNGVMQATAQVNSAGALYHPSRLFVKFRPGNRPFLPGSTGAGNFPLDRDLFLVNTPPGLSVAAAVAQYRNNPNVVYAEPDYYVSVVTTPNDTRFSEQWDMLKIGATSSWDNKTTANSLVVAIVDTGIDENHPDLLGNVLSGYSCINVPVGGSCTPGQIDDFGHGTHVAGTIGAVGNNNLGVAGMNWSVKMMAFKFLNSSGSGSTSDAVFAFNKIAELKAAGTNIRLTNNSWGGGGFSQALKDAMAAVESMGIVNVCASGNSNVDTTVSPMYPAAYDNRGIISVLASDINDAGASFTNYGMANVDIAAPGVNILSTVPSTGCQLCDPSGYLYLNGTSMATPHVAGAVAAMLDKNGSLGAWMARDILLDPGSWDSVSDAKAKSTSTGGRLNLSKLLGNPKLTTPPQQLNAFPSITVGSNVFAGANQQVTLSATASDPDPADNAGLRMSWGKSSASAWLFGNMLNTLFPNPSGNPSNFTTPSTGRMVSMPYLAVVTDNRGGSAFASQIVTVNPVSSLGGPDGSFSVSPLSVTRVNGTASVTVNYAPVDPDEKGTPMWDIWATGLNGSSGNCCYGGTSAIRTFTSSGVYRVSVNSMDKYMEGSTLTTAGRKTAVVSVDGATGTPPLATASVTQASGPVPLTVTVDMSGSLAFDGKTIKYYFISCGEGFVPGGSGAARTCTFDTPGTYWLMEQVQDSAGLMDLVNLYVVATPVNGGGGGDNTPPTVSITSPSANSNLKGTTQVTANASDNAGGSGMKDVVFRLDNASSGTIIGTASGAGPTFTINNWNTALVTDGAHTIYGIATDNSNNSAASTGVPVVIDNTAPTVSITSPANSATVFGTVSINTNAADTGTGINNVVFWLDGVGTTQLGTVSTAPYNFSWNSAGASNGGHTLTVVATDKVGNTTTSTTINVSVDNSIAPPTISLTFASLTPLKKSNDLITAVVSPGGAPAVTRVDFYINGSLVGSSTTSPYQYNWKVSAAAGRTYSIYGVVTDSLGRTATSNTTTIKP
jgi:subtilisin family serine protease